jgi:hypothetical protein
MHITVDPYYDIQFYNECKEALKNNTVDFKEFINTKPPFHWYFQLDQKPLLVNFDKATNSEERWMVNAVKPLRPNEEYLFLRRDNDVGQKALLKYIENEPLKEMRKTGYGVFFTIKNREEAQEITKDFPGKIWFFGKYYANKFRVCFCSNKMIKNYLSNDQILLENDGEYKEVGRFESELNFKVFRGNDMLIKFTETPFFEDGRYSPVNIKGELSNKFII